MHTRKCSSLSIELTEGVDVTAVSANAFFHDRNTECFLLDVFETLLDFKLGYIRNALLEGGFHLIAKCPDFLTTLNFVGGVDSVFDTVAGNFVSDLKEVFLGNGHGVVTLRLTHLSGKFLDGGYDSSNVALSEVESFDKFAVRDLISSTFDHDTLGFVTDVNKIKITVFALFEGRVDDKLTINTTNANSTDSACEGNIRDTKGSGCAVHAQDISIVNSVSGKHQGNNLSVVEVAFWEKRTQRTVCHTACEDFLFSRTSFTLEVATGKNSSSSSTLFVFNGKWEPGLALTNFGLGNSGDKQHGFSRLHLNGAVGQLGQLTRLNGDRVRPQRDRYFFNIHFHFLIFFFCWFALV